LRGKNKSFVEDTIILLVIGVIIYAIYTFFFASTQEAEMQTETIAIERNISTDTQVDKESVNKQNVPIEKINEDLTQTQKEEPLKIEETTKDIIESIPEDKIDDRAKIKRPEIKTEVQSVSEIGDVELFFRNIEEKIYANIEKNIDQTSIKNNAFVNIRVTILKDGRYEQLTFMDGSKDNFELFKPSITQVFPLQMNDTLKENFPRYFRMKIEIK
jgi:hypothetical protein